MVSDLELIPSILTNDPEELRDKMSELEGKVSRVHIDIIDGVFANNKTIDPSLLEEVETSILLDFHLMTKNPTSWVERCLRGGADRVIGQVEMMDGQQEFVKKCQEVDLKIGLSLDLDTPVSKIAEEVLVDLDVVLVMGVPAGFGGQKFNPDCLAKIEELTKLKKKLNARYDICADGGETTEIEKIVVDRGANQIVVGRKLFDGNLEKNIEKYQVWK